METDKKENFNSDKGAVKFSLPLSKSFYKECFECGKLKMIGIQCICPITRKCQDWNKEWFYDSGNGT